MNKSGEKRRPRFLFALMTGTALFVAIFFFQNCMDPGFDPKWDGSNRAASVGLPSTVASSVADAATANPIPKVTIGEMVPLELLLPSELPPGSVDPQRLPKGAAYDEAKKMLRWLPQKGQAGFYEIPLKGLKAGPDIVAPDSANRLVACYDGRSSVKNAAPAVARQILASACGKYNKCVIITHSMGGLMLEYMFTHTRDPLPSDPEPALFDDRVLFQQVKDRTLIVISIASAAGGSKVADILGDPTR